MSESAGVTTLMLAFMVLTSLLSDLCAFSLGSQSLSLRGMHWISPSSSMKSTISSLYSGDLSGDSSSGESSGSSCSSVLGWC